MPDSANTKKVLDSANGAKIRQILREFGYKIGRYDMLGVNKGAESALDSATRALKNNRRVNRVILFFGDMDLVLDSKKSAESRAICAQPCSFNEADLQNLTQNGVEIVVFLKDNTGATTALNFWRTFGIVYLIKNRFIN